MVLHPLPSPVSQAALSTEDSCVAPAAAVISLSLLCLVGVHVASAAAIMTPVNTTIKSLHNCVMPPRILLFPVVKPVSQLDNVVIKVSSSSLVSSAGYAVYHFLVELGMMPVSFSAFF